MLHLRGVLGPEGGEKGTFVKIIISFPALKLKKKKKKKKH